jgi:hypothetical protein
MNSLSKTRRRVSDISGNNFTGMVSDRADQFMKFLTSNSEDAFTRPWHRLERGMRINRLRKYTEEEALRFNLSDEEREDMLQTLIKVHDKKQLNSKSIVTYDQAQQKILEVKGFVFHRQADGKVVFQFTERKSITLKKRPSSATSQAALESKQ